MLLVALCYPGQRAHGCSCGVPSVEQSLEFAPAIFHGTLIEIERLDPLPLLLLPILATFEVQAVWKGTVGERLEVVTDVPDAHCGIGFEFLRAGVGSEFVVYGSEKPKLGLDPRHIYTTICTRTARFTLEEVEALGDPLWTSADGIAFVRGDCNGDGDTSGISDAIFHLSFNFRGTEEPLCRAACDVNGDGEIGGVSDAIFLLTFNFLNGPAPVMPFPACGLETLDPTTALECAVQSNNCGI